MTVTFERDEMVRKCELLEWLEDIRRNLQANR